MMKKWMVRFMSVLAVFALSVGVTGCGQGEQNGDPEVETREMEEQAEESASEAEESMEESVDEMDNE